MTDNTLYYREAEIIHSAIRNGYNPIDVEQEREAHKQKCPHCSKSNRLIFWPELDSWLCRNCGRTSKAEKL